MRYGELRKSPGFAITATAMLAVAICANSNRVQLDRRHDVASGFPARGGHGRSCEPAAGRTELLSDSAPSPYLDYRDLRGAESHLRRNTRLSSRLITLD